MEVLEKSVEKKEAVVACPTCGLKDFVSPLGPDREVEGQKIRFFKCEASKQDYVRGVFYADKNRHLDSPQRGCLFASFAVLPDGAKVEGAWGLRSRFVTQDGKPFDSEVGMSNPAICFYRLDDQTQIENLSRSVVQAFRQRDRERAERARVRWCVERTCEKFYANTSHAYCPYCGTPTSNEAPGSVACSDADCKRHGVKFAPDRGEAFCGDCGSKLK